MEKIFKKQIEFYITNVCNYNCDNCNRLNNYYFSGHEAWGDYEAVYQRWSERIEFGRITVLGGEPLLHPSLDQWILGLRRFWPRANIRINTNGTRLRYWYRRGFFDLLSSNDIELTINTHNRSNIDKVHQEVNSYLKDPVTEIIPRPDLDWSDAYRAVKDQSWPDCATYQDFVKLPIWIQNECRQIHGIDYDQWVKNTGFLKVQDRLDPKIKIVIDHYENFVTAPLKYSGENTFTVYNSDPDAAHRVCRSKHCTHMMHGKMYKCHHMGILKEFSRQFEVAINGEDRNLLESYQPLEVTADTATMQDFLEQHIKNVIPQCKLCPSELKNIFLQSSTDKPKIKKIILIKPLSVV